MQALVECPVCSYQAELELEDEMTMEPELAARALREHVLWTHYQSGDWGTAPNGRIAVALFFQLGVLEEPEAKAAFDRVWKAETPRPSWFERYGMLWLFVPVAFLWGAIEGWLFGSSGAWFPLLLGAVGVSLWPLASYLGFRRIWKGHPTRKELETLTVPDAIPESDDPA